MEKVYFTKDNLTDNINCALNNPVVLDNQHDNPHYGLDYRRWQSAPCAAVTKNGRIFCTFSGDNSNEAWECPNNYNQISYSDDNGNTWHHEAFVIDHMESVRLHEPILWISPDGVLHHFWSQSYEWYDGRAGVWTMSCAEPDAEKIVWSAPRRICDGVMACPPIAYSKNEWLYPVSVWKHYRGRLFSLPEVENSNVYVSTDGGKTLTYRGCAVEKDTLFDENTIAKRPDGSLVMTMRCITKISMSESFDKGISWSEPKKLMNHTSSRSFLCSLPSGNIMLITNDDEKMRKNMTAFVSHDGGKTFPYKLLLDERCETSYPAGCVTSDGKVYVAFDYNRTSDKEIMLAVVTEQDVIRGALSTPLKLVAKAGSALDNNYVVPKSYTNEED